MHELSPLERIVYYIYMDYHVSEVRDLPESIRLAWEAGQSVFSVMRENRDPNPADQTPPSGGRLHPVVGQSICPVCDKPIEENEISSTGYIDYHKECNLVDGNFNEEIK